MGVEGDIIDHAHAAASATEFRDATLASLRAQIGFDSGIFFTTGGPDVGPPGNYNKPPEAAAIFRHYRANVARYERDLVKGRVASLRDGAFIDRDVYSAREREHMAFFDEILRPQQITTRLMAYLSIRGEPRSVVQLCRHGRSQPFDHRDLLALRALVPLLALADGSAALPRAKGRLDQLTARERQIVSYVGHGYTNKEIATVLGCSPNTIRNHLAAVFGKLGVASRAELAAWVARTIV